MESNKNEIKELKAKVFKYEKLIKNRYLLTRKDLVKIIRLAQVEDRDGIEWMPQYLDREIIAEFKDKFVSL